jgi:DNA (cytosine-5)-methyltransferase 1
MAHPLTTFHLFAGAGGGILADLLLGHTPVGACEIEPYPRSVLLQRQRDGVLPGFPIWDDINTLDGTPWRGSVDVLAGGFPCQDISSAGKGAGISGERSGLWKEYARLIGEMRPRFVFAENSPLLRTRGLGVVLEDLASLGYNARWGIIGARDVGAPHKRDRMWVMAHTNGIGVEGHELCKPDLPTRPSSGEEGSDLAHTERKRQSRSGKSERPSSPAQNQDREADRAINSSKANANWWVTEPDVGRVAYGVAARVDRLKAIGNGQVPAVAALAWQILSQDLLTQ